jgi:aryl-alcohol dehydrogenase-like predicted oxidoreductase
LKLERIDLYELHAPDPRVPLEESVGMLAELRAAGKVRHIGLSNVSVKELRRAQGIVPIVSVQNRYNFSDRSSDDVLAVCEKEGIAFLPWYPLAAGGHAAVGGALARVARRHGATRVQVAIAWLLARSPIMVPIPGTSTLAHLEENVALPARRAEIKTDRDNLHGGRVGFLFVCEGRPNSPLSGRLPSKAVWG